MGHESDRHRSGRHKKKSRSEERDERSHHRTKKRKNDGDSDHKRKERSSSSRSDSRKEDRTSSSRHQSKRGDDDSRERRHGKRHHRKHATNKESSRHHNKKRHRDDDDSSRNPKRKKKHDHSKKKDSKKKRSKKESSSNSKKVKVDKSKLYPLGDPLGYAPEKLLDPEEDYFSHHKHLWLYLYRDCGVSFNDLSSDEARKAFADFCKRYNKGELEAGYYSDQLPSAALDECKTTSHRWSIRISDQEDKNLHDLQEGIQKQTEYQVNNSADRTTGPSMRPSASSKTPTASGASTSHKGEKHPPPRQTAQERIAERTANRRLREHARTSEEEMLGGRKDYGRERMIEKRRELAEKIHGAARDREGASIELTDDALYGGDDKKNFEKALAKSKDRTARREEQKQARVAELQNKEKEKQTAMLELLGLTGKIQAGENIKIAPRTTKEHD